MVADVALPPVRQWTALDAIQKFFQRPCGRGLLAENPPDHRFLPRYPGIVTVGILRLKQTAVSACIDIAVDQHAIGGAGVQRTAVLKPGGEMLSRPAVGKARDGAPATKQVVRHLLSGQFDLHDGVLKRPRCDDVRPFDLAGRDRFTVSAEVADGDVGLRIGPQPGIQPILRPVLL